MGLTLVSDDPGKVIVIPDILGNAGGGGVSYFEYVLDRSRVFWIAEEVDSDSNSS